MPGPGSVACPKPERRQTTKRRKDRQESIVEARVRAQVDEREESGCRVGRILRALSAAVPFLGDRDLAQRIAFVVTWLGPCNGPIEWAHLFRRSASRGMAPEVRHATATSMMCCNAHHQGPRGHERHGFDVEYVDPARGADDRLRLIVKNVVVEELDAPRFVV